MGESAHDMTPSANTGRIEAEIAQTRSQMRETISAIQDRLTPSHVLQRAKDTAREATVGRVKQMAHELGHRASDLTGTAGTTAVRTARANSMPLALIDLGIGWLMARNWSGSRGSNWSGSRRMSAAGDTNWSDDPWVEDEMISGNRRLSTTPDEAGSTTGTVREAAARSAERVRDVASQSAERVRHVASQGAEQVSMAARRTQSGLERALRDNPLAVGVAVLAAGLAVGALMPRTHVEDEYLGTTRDTMLDKARETAQSAVQQVTVRATEGARSSGPSAV